MTDVDEKRVAWLARRGTPRNLAKRLSRLLWHDGKYAVRDGRLLKKKGQTFNAGRNQAKRQRRAK